MKKRGSSGNLGWNASPSRPRSPPVVISAEMSRNGWLARCPFVTTQIRPACVTTNSLPLPSPASTTPSGPSGTSTTGSSATSTADERPDGAPPDADPPDGAPPDGDPPDGAPPDTDPPVGAGFEAGAVGALRVGFAVEPRVHPARTIDASAPATTPARRRLPRRGLRLVIDRMLEPVARGPPAQAPCPRTRAWIARCAGSRDAETHRWRA